MMSERENTWIQSSTESPQDQGGVETEEIELSGVLGDKLRDAFIDEEGDDKQLRHIVNTVFNYGDVPPFERTLELVESEEGVESVVAELQKFVADEQDTATTAKEINEIVDREL